MFSIVLTDKMETVASVLH